MNMPARWLDHAPYAAKKSPRLANRLRNSGSVLRLATGQTLEGVTIRYRGAKSPSLIVEDSEPAKSADWLQHLYSASEGVEPSDTDIAFMFDAIEAATYPDKGVVNADLLRADVSKLAVEFLVGIPRALYPLRDVLSEWLSFVSRAKLELERRREDVQGLMQGL